MCKMSSSTLLQQVLNIPNIQWFVVTPDGNTVYYLLSFPTNQLYSVPITGGTPTLHLLKVDVSTDAQIYIFCIDPSGTYLVAPSDIPGGTGLFLWNLSSLTTPGTRLGSDGVDFGDIAITSTYVYYVTAPTTNIKRINYLSEPYTSTTIYSPKSSVTYNGITVDSNDQTVYVSESTTNTIFSLAVSGGTPNILYSLSQQHFSTSFLLQNSFLFYTDGGESSTIFRNGIPILGTAAGGTSVLNCFCIGTSPSYPLLISTSEGIYFVYFTRPYPVPPPPPQQKVVCLDRYPLPTSAKKPVYTFNRREFWSWGANKTGRNCVQGDTITE
jgi:hypothetical protein